MKQNQKDEKELNVYEKRFLLLMKLIKIDKMLGSAKIKHVKMDEEK